MRGPCVFILLVGCLVMSLPVGAATGRVKKVLPHFLDKAGRHSLYPSLYERDAYQALLRSNPDRRSGLRFDVEWKAKGAIFDPLTLRAEVRGIASGGLPKQLIIEKQVRKRGGLRENWDGLVIGQDDYAYLGEITAWRVTLWEGSTLLHERKSFLW